MPLSKLPEALSDVFAEVVRASDAFVPALVPRELGTVSSVSAVAAVSRACFWASKAAVFFVRSSWAAWASSCWVLAAVTCAVISFSRWSMAARMGAYK